MKAYFLSIVAVALLTAIIRKLVGEQGTMASALKLMTGLLLTFAVISPLKDFHFSGMNDIAGSYASDAEQLVREGEKITSEAVSSIITQRTRAYIIEKAKTYDADLEVSVTLTSEDIPRPYAVTIKGNISPYVKSELQNIIQSDLGIPKEHQTWT